MIKLTKKRTEIILQIYRKIENKSVEATYKRLIKNNFKIGESQDFAKKSAFLKGHTLQEQRDSNT